MKSSVLIVSNIFFGLFSLFMVNACGQNPQIESKQKEAMSININSDNNKDTATFGAGCFWCVEAVFQQLNGVEHIESGYSGGTIKNPAYREVCEGTTGHAEVCRIIYDPRKINFDELLEVFWKTHDPTTLNRQGNDFGTQYRSVIFYHNENQKAAAEKYKAEINKSGAYPTDIVTEISPLINYYPAEDYHQNYYNLNGSEGYCRYVIQPKLEKFEKIFKHKMKK
ncbi:MAG: peptide-methionine (S)-S-oxide reductase MsrA [Sphingobacteriaceae bacterium]|nr:peptide-methionine (S)-S-oxide reductase MsrA [Sphingobacteriaceae bacterium]